MAREPTYHGLYDGGSPNSGANTTPTGTGRYPDLHQLPMPMSQFPELQSNGRATRSVPFSEGHGIVSELRSSMQSPQLANNAADVHMTSSSVEPDAQPPIILATQSQQPLEEVRGDLSLRDVVTPTGNSQLPKPLLRKRRQSDPGTMPSKRTKTRNTNKALDTDTCFDTDSPSIDKLLSTQESLPAEFDTGFLNSTDSKDGASPDPRNANKSSLPIEGHALAIPSTSNIAGHILKDEKDANGSLHPFPGTSSKQKQLNPTDSTSVRPRAPSRASKISRPIVKHPNVSEAQQQGESPHVSAIWPTRDDEATLAALVTVEDPDHQKNLAKYHNKRSLIAARELMQKVYDQRMSTAFKESDGWINSAAQSRADGRKEIGLIAQYLQPVLRANSRQPAQKQPYWMPGPDGIFIMCKLCLGLIVWNDENVKLMKTFTTKSGTDKEFLRRSGLLKYYAQVVRSPQEEGRVPHEKGVANVFMFETFADKENEIDWNVGGPRLMETMTMYEHPRGKPYRIVGALKGNGYDEDLLCDMWEDNAERAIRQTYAAFDARRANPDWFRQYRSVPQSMIGDDTVVDEVCLIQSFVCGACLGACLLLISILVTCAAPRSQWCNSLWSHVKTSSTGQHCQWPSPEQARCELQEA